MTSSGAQQKKAVPEELVVEKQVAHSTQQQQSRLKSMWGAASANPLTAAIVSAVITGLVTVPVTIICYNSIGQSGANNATIEAEKDATQTELMQDAELVSYGLGDTSPNSSPQIVIENRSYGWIRNVTLTIPISFSGGNGSFSSQGIIVYPVEGNGPQGVNITGRGINTPPTGNFRDPLADVGPCELAVTTVLKAVPHVSPAALAQSELVFTDPNGNTWGRFGSDRLVRIADPAGVKEWSPYAISEPLPGCS